MADVEVRGHTAAVHFNQSTHTAYLLNITCQSTTPRQPTNLLDLLALQAAITGRLRSCNTEYRPMESSLREQLTAVACYEIGRPYLRKFQEIRTPIFEETA